MAEDLESPCPGADDCVRCGLEWWACLCDPLRPHRQLTEAEIEAGREERLALAERGRLGVGGV